MVHVDRLLALSSLLCDTKCMPYSPVVVPQAAVVLVSKPMRSEALKTKPYNRYPVLRDEVVDTVKLLWMRRQVALEV